MARPQSRRPGYNRKAQYGLFASYVVAVTGALIALLLIVIAMADPAGFSVLRSGAGEVTRPVSSALEGLVSGVGSVDENISAYIRAGSQNAALRRELAAARPRLIEAEAIEQENSRLKKLLKLVNEDSDEVLSARLISSTSGSTRRFARLNAGRSQGAMPGMPVRAPEGLIGRISASGLTNADVLLLTDNSSIVPVRRTKDNIAAICQGNSDGTVSIKPLGTGRNPFRPGDIVVTSGTGGVYQPNIPVAIIVKLTADGGIGVPLANPSRVEAVIVQRPFEEAVTRPLAEPANAATSGAASNASDAE